MAKEKGFNFRYLQVYVGLDYLGSLQVKEGKVTQKMWICLFTCSAVCTVYLELVKGLSAQLFLDCLRQFIARRGNLTSIISDNAPQFCLMKTALDQHGWMYTRMKQYWAFPIKGLNGNCDWILENCSKSHM